LASRRPATILFPQRVGTAARVYVKPLLVPSAATASPTLWPIVFSCSRQSRHTLVLTVRLYPPRIPPTCGTAAAPSCSPICHGCHGAPYLPLLAARSTSRSQQVRRCSGMTCNNMSGGAGITRFDGARVQLRATLVSTEAAGVAHQWGKGRGNRRGGGEFFGVGQRDERGGKWLVFLFIISGWTSGPRVSRPGHVPVPQSSIATSTSQWAACSERLLKLLKE
jgi:hypothetical protein